MTSSRAEPVPWSPSSRRDLALIALLWFGLAVATAIAVTSVAGEQPRWVVALAAWCGGIVTLLLVQRIRRLVRARRVA